MNIIYFKHLSYVGVGTSCHTRIAAKVTHSSTLCMETQRTRHSVPRKQKYAQI